MANQKSRLTTIIAIVASLVVFAAGAAKLYRGINSLSGSEQDPKVTELLNKSDASIADANSQVVVAAPAFQALLADFDTLGLVAFRAEKQDACKAIVEQFSAANAHLLSASKSLSDAIALGTDAKTTAFLQEKAKSYDLLAKVGSQNIDIIRATLDEAIADADAVIEKVTSIATARDADQKAAEAASAAADAALKQS